MTSPLTRSAYVESRPPPRRRHHRGPVPGSHRRTRRGSGRSPGPAPVRSRRGAPARPRPLRRAGRHPAGQRITRHDRGVQPEQDARRQVRRLLAQRRRLKALRRHQRRRLGRGHPGTGRPARGRQPDPDRAQRHQGPARPGLGRGEGRASLWYVDIPTNSVVVQATQQAGGEALVAAAAWTRTRCG
ncbi:S1 family peptidase [Streptosporangium lutulentum]